MFSLAIVAFASESYAERGCPSFFGVDQERDTIPRVRYGGGPVDGLAPVGQSLFSIVASTDKSNATAKYSLSASSAEDLDQLAAGPIEGCSHALSLTLSSPIDKSDTTTDLATLTGLANAFTFTVEYARYHDTISLHLDEIHEQLKVISGNADITLNRANLIRKFGNKHPIIDQFNAAGKVVTWFWGGSATVGRESFDYVNFDDSGKVTESQQPWSISAFLGGEFGVWTITGRIKGEKSFKAQPSVTRCRPMENAGWIWTVEPGHPEPRWRRPVGTHRSSSGVV